MACCCGDRSVTSCEPCTFGEHRDCEGMEWNMQHRCPECGVVLLAPNESCRNCGWTDGDG